MSDYIKFSSAKVLPHSLNKANKRVSLSSYLKFCMALFFKTPYMTEIAV